MRRPEFVGDGDPDARERRGPGGDGPVHDGAVVVAEEHDPVRHGRRRAEVDDALQRPRGDVRLEAQRLIVVHRPPGVRVVRGIRERIVVGAPIHDAEVGEVPGGRRRVRLERLVEPRDARVVGTQVRR